MICTFPVKKNVRHCQQKEMVLVLYTCFVVNHLNPETVNHTFSPYVYQLIVLGEMIYLIYQCISRNSVLIDHLPPYLKRFKGDLSFLEEYPKKLEFLRIDL